MIYEIKNRWSGKVIFSIETYTWRLAVEAAIKAGANLFRANLSRTDLFGANLSGANLTEADLTGANLSEADLTKVNLRPIKHDVWGILLQSRAEVPALRLALIDGKVDGSFYMGKCSCLCGTLANAKNGRVSDGSALPFADNTSAAERFFMGIKKGDTPEMNPVSKLALEWVEEFLELTKVI